MRLFIAADLPDNVIEALAETSARLRGAIHGRYVAPDSFHVTLAFLGDVPSNRIDAAANALEAGCRAFSAFDVSLGVLGSFGKRSTATLWQGFEKADELRELANSVRRELSDADFSFDEKPFKAHITLMRKADLTSGALPSPAIASGRIESASLYSSDLSGPRPLYEPLHTVNLSSGVSDIAEL